MESTCQVLLQGLTGDFVASTPYRLFGRSNHRWCRVPPTRDTRKRTLLVFLFPATLRQMTTGPAGAKTSHAPGDVPCNSERRGSWDPKVSSPSHPWAKFRVTSAHIRLLKVEGAAQPSQHGGPGRPLTCRKGLGSVSRPRRVWGGRRGYGGPGRLGRISGRLLLQPISVKTFLLHRKALSPGTTNQTAVFSLVAGKGHE